MWVCGHTHTHMKYAREGTGTIMLVNPLGYPEENPNSTMCEIKIGTSINLH